MCRGVPSVHLQADRRRHGGAAAGVVPMDHGAAEESEEIKLCMQAGGGPGGLPRFSLGMGGTRVTRRVVNCVHLQADGLKRRHGAAAARVMVPGADPC